MSEINCGACGELRETSPEFVVSGVTDPISASLQNNTGLNPTLPVLHKNCEDLNNINDCLIGRMADELPAYDTCDWKDYMGKLIPNLYEARKADIASDCGQWNRIEALCNSVDDLFGLFGGSSAKPHWMTPTPLFREKFYAWFNYPSGQVDATQYFFPQVQSEIRQGRGCNKDRSLFCWRPALGIKVGPTYPYTWGSGVRNLQPGDILGYIRKDELVPHDMPEYYWRDTIMRGIPFNYATAFVLNRIKRIIVSLRGYIVIEGVEFNADLKNTYGPDVAVMEVQVCEDGISDGGIWGRIDPLLISWV